MRNSFITIFGMRSTLELFANHERAINGLINNLKLVDVESDAAFSATTQKVKRQVIFQPIEFGEAKFVDHSYHQRQFSFYEQVSGRSSESYIHIVKIPFSGSAELLRFVPSGFSYSGSEPGIIDPVINPITVYVPLPELNPSKAVSESSQILQQTFGLARANNSALEDWSIRVASRIDQQMEQKREELIRLFRS